MHSFRNAFVLLAAMLAGMSASAQYVSLAANKEGAYAWDNQPSQKLADQKALASCRRVAKQHGQEGCTLLRTQFFVRAVGGGRIGFSGGETLQGAEAEALRHCGNAECKVDRRFTAPGFYSVAMTTGNSEDTRTHASYGYDNFNVAVRDAISKCEESGGGKCSTMLSGVITGRLQRDASTPVPVATNNPASCRPTTPTVRCSSQCTNGNCVITYENGCKVRVQVSPQFDSFTNQWKYPAPSC